ncbi:MAG: hypothetical protein M1821_008808 [Bathelium mastoideum]|nr:MAG: hypothetical protein M1821_008808 [Bathelium mastoideum]KAI9687615.1 MAG: hypothetical protein M1822_002225 [Bathelium mastoideum]
MVTWEYEPCGEGEKAVQHFLTKGDNNENDDVALYPVDRHTVLRDEVLGIVRGYIPYLGWAAILPRELLRNINDLVAEHLRELYVPRH